MKKVTNAVLAEKIDSMHKTLKEDIKPAVKENTEFRLQAKGAMALFGIFMMVTCAAMTWGINKISNIFK